MTAARFRAHRDLQGFDFAESKVDKNLVRQLHTLSFLDAAHNLIFIGGPSTGKTHLATALGVEAIDRHGKRVRFFSTIELVNALKLKKAAGKQGQIAHRLMYADLVILMSWAICRSVRPAVRCGSTCCPNSTSAPVWRSRPTTALQNGPQCSGPQR